MTADNLKTNDVEITEDVSFRDMMLSKQVLAGLTKCNFEKPSPIQLRAIPIGRCGLGNCYSLYLLMSIIVKYILMMAIFAFSSHRFDNSIKIRYRKNFSVLYNNTRTIQSECESTTIVDCRSNT